MIITDDLYTVIEILPSVTISKEYLDTMLTNIYVVDDASGGTFWFDAIRMTQEQHTQISELLIDGKYEFEGYELDIEIKELDNQVAKA